MTSPDPGPVVSRLMFGGRARELREAAGLDLAQAAERTGMEADKLSKVENGVLGTKAPEVERMIASYGVPGQTAAELRDLGVRGRKRADPGRVVDSGRRYVALERDAAEMSMVYNEVPGALQTAEYAAAQLRRSPIVLPAQVEDMAAAREARGDAIMAKTGRPVRIVLGEDALQRFPAGLGRVAARGQLDRLRAFADLPHVSLRVHPRSAGTEPALSCPFTLLWIEPANVLIAYAEILSSADYLKNTGAYVVAFDAAVEHALSEDDTRALLEKLADEL